MNWTPTADGYHCKTHDEKFKRGRVCTHCRIDTPADDDGSSAQVDTELLAFAGECSSNARKMWGEAESLLEDGTAIDVNTAVKCSDAAVKWHRLALEVKDRVAGRRQLREAMAHENAMSGSRGRA